jgi:AraC-like DNA-binding protein
MTVKLLDKDWMEMIEEFPICAFSCGKDLQETQLSISNKYGESSVSEIRTSHFCISDSCTQCMGDCKVFSKAENINGFCFCTVIQGMVSCYGKYLCCKEDNWLAGHANLWSCREMEGYSCFAKNKPCRTINIMLSPAYMEEIAHWYPLLFDSLLDKYMKGESFRMFSKNRLLCPVTNRALNDMLNYKVIGNAAPLYLDAKILEILSLFTCRSESKDCSACSCYSSRDKDMFFMAKSMIEQQYRNPPSLCKLALMVGTNVDKLKKGFKILFGTTVFGYLSDYRMNLASQYLLDTDKTIQEIADTIGYEYHSHFTTAFKRKFYVSPQEYRNQMRK